MVRPSISKSLRFYNERFSRPHIRDGEFSSSVSKFVVRRNCNKISNGHQETMKLKKSTYEPFRIGVSVRLKVCDDESRLKFLLCFCLANFMKARDLKIEIS